MQSYFQAVYDWIKASFAKIIYTKYLLGIITVGFTAAVLPLFRFVAKAKGGNISKAADATYWVLSCIFGIGILVYPWWLATAKSPLYYSRLQYYGRIISMFIILLAGIQGIFTPTKPFNKSDPDTTSLAYQVISSLDIVAILGGLLILLPILIRRDRLFKSNSKALFRFAWAFTLIMIVGMLLNRCMGYNRIVSYSCVVIILQFGVCDYLEALDRQRNNRVGKFDEAYIIIAGFVPFWIAFAVGGTLLEIVSQSGSTGTVFVYVSWRVVIYAFEYMAGEVGRKASRYSDGSVFSYSAIYTGAAFGNFVFLSVRWNSGTFWALLMVTVLNIIIVNGGLVIDMDYWFVDYFAVSEHWPRLYHLKVLYYEMCREMPKTMASKIAKCGSNPSPEVQLALIRSRAKFLQLNWVHNDIKMSSEFQALACACTAVGMEMVYSHYNVGADSITANSLDRRDILYILVVQVLFMFFAQAIARRRLRHKVSRLKREISHTVKALEGTSNPMARRRSVSTGGYTGLPATSPHRRGSTSPVNVPVSPTGAKSHTGRSVTAVLAGWASALTGRAFTSPPQGDVEQGNAGEEECEQTDQLLIAGGEVDGDALNAILGLCSLYADESRDAKAEASDSINNNDNSVGGTCPSTPVRSNLPFSSANSRTLNVESSPKSRLRFGNIRFGVIGQSSSAAEEEGDAESEDDWGEVQLTNSRQSLSDQRRGGGGGGHGGGGLQRRVSGFLFGQPRRGSTRNANTSTVRMQGYLNKRKPGTNSIYQRRFFVLTERQLMWFASEEDVETHINRRKGAINIANIANIDRYDPTSLCIINITVRGRVYILLASDRTLADEWYDMMQGLRDVQKAQDAPPPQDFEEQQDEDDVDASNINIFPWFSGAVAAAQSRYLNRHSADRGARPDSRVSRGPIVSGFSSLLGMHQVEAPAADSHVSRAMRRGTMAARMGVSSLFGATAYNTSDTTEIDADCWKSSWNVCDLPCKSGYIQKKGELNSSWQHRWFVMDDCGVLSWYEKAGQEQSQPSRGEIAVWEVSRIEPVDTGAPRLIVMLHIHGRMYELEACSELDARDWRDILEKWVFSARSAVEKYHLEQYHQAEEKHHCHETVSRNHEDVPFLEQRARRKTGFLQKRGEFNSDWRRRWFELDDYALSWYERNGIDSKHQKLKGSLQLNEVLCVKARSYDAPCLVEVMHTQGRTYELEAETTVEAEDWRLQLNLWLREAYSVAKSAQLGLCAVDRTEARPQSLSIDHSLPRTERTDSSDSTKEIESAKLEATKSRYFMYSNWSLKHKTARKKKREEDGEFGTLSLPPIPGGQGSSENSEMKSQELPEGEPNFISATETIEALSRQHAVQCGEIVAVPQPVRAVGFMEPNRQQNLKENNHDDVLDDDESVSSIPFISNAPFKSSQPFAAVSSVPFSSPVPPASSRRPFLTAASILAHGQVINDIVHGEDNDILKPPPPEPDEQSHISSSDHTASPSFSRLYATIAADAVQRDDSPLQLTENPAVCRSPRRMSAVELSIEQRKRGFTTSVPVSQLRRQAKRQNILSGGAKTLSSNPTTENRRESDLADTKFLHRMAKRHSSELVDNLQKRSYKDINAEFWDTHLWYLACVVCFVTLNVLYTTSYIMNRYK